MYWRAGVYLITSQSYQQGQGEPRLVSPHVSLESGVATTTVSLIAFTPPMPYGPDDTWQSATSSGESDVHEMEQGALPYSSAPCDVL